MSRPLRIEHPGALWHITARGNEQKDIYRDEADREKFLELLGQAVERSKWIVHEYVLMDNHYHLVIETPEPTLSRGMQWLNSQYARYVNRRYDRVGHLFQGRFTGLLVEKESYFLTLGRYVVLNRVRAGLVPGAGDWKWSSYGAKAGLREGPAWLTLSTTLDYFHPKDRREAQRHYREFIEATDALADRPWDQLRNQIYLGSDAWMDKVQKMIDEAPRSEDHPRAQRHLHRPKMEQVVEAVAKAYSTEPASITGSRGGPARMLTAYLGVYEGLHFCRTIAPVLRLRSQSRVSGLVRECERELLRDPILQRHAATARKHLDNRPPPTPYVLRRPAQDVLRESPTVDPS